MHEAQPRYLQADRHAIFPAVILYIPGLFHLLSLKPEVIRFHRQLLIDQKEEDAIQIYRRLNAMLNRAIYRLWAAHTGFAGDPEEGQALHLALIDLWLLYLDPKDISCTSLINNSQHINNRLKWFRDGGIDFGLLVQH